MVNFTPSFKKDSEDKRIRYELVTKYMTTNVISFTPEQEVQEVIDIIIANKISGAPVLNSKKELIGIISEKDCLRLIIDNAYHNLETSLRQVSSYMSKDVKTVSADMDVVDVANKFLLSNFRRYPVVDNGKFIGLISRRDILKAAKEVKKTTL